LKAFIDDIVLHATANPNNTFEELLQRAQHNMRWWDKLVQVTGGSLNSKKCCTIAYTWHPDQHGILTLTTNLPTPPPIGLSDHNEHPPINFIPMTEGVCYLGVYIAGNWLTKPMESHLWDKALTYMRAFQKTPMTRWEAGILY